jgi:hypothetical protein
MTKNKIQKKSFQTLQVGTEQKKMVALINNALLGWVQFCFLRDHRETHTEKFYE